MGYFSALATAGKFLAPHLGRAGITLAGLAGGGQAISAGARAIDGDNPDGYGLADGLGISAKSIAENETFDPTKDKLVGWDAGDQFRTLFGGANRQQVEQAARQEFQTDMNDLATRKNRSQDRRLTAIGIDEVEPLVYETKEGKAGFNDRFTERDNLIGKLEELKALDGDMTGFNLSSSASSVQAAIDERRAARNLTTPGSQAWTANEGLKLQQQQANQNAYQFQVQQQQTAASERNRNAQLDADRELRRGEGKDRMELAILDREGQREELRFRREDRADARRRDSMMMLMKGLSQLGAGFAL